MILLAVVAGLVLLATQDATALCWVALLLVAGVPAVSGPWHRLAGPLGRAAEVLVVGLGASSVAAAAERAGTVGSGLAAAAVLPYLTVPLTAAALHRRSREPAVLLGLASATLAVAGLLTEVGGRPQLTQAGYLAVSVQWLVTAALGVLATGVLQRAAQSKEPAPQPYAEATRLLTQLRSVARQLPGATLDPGSISEHLLEELRTVARADRAAVLSASGGGRLVVLAQTGADRVDWETTLDADSAIADAWASQQPQTANRSQARS
ncbi:MAG TPA: ATPase, partial [Pilimelia sp.]|nr:ATPase [Pilimelia sp.]